MDDFALKEVAASSLTGDYFKDLSGDAFSPDLLRNTGFVTTLTGSESASFGSVSGIGIFQSSDPEVRTAQKKLISFLFRSDVYNTWLHMSPGGMLPVRKTVLEDSNFFRDPEGIFSKYGRDRIAALIESMEDLKVINPERLIENPGNVYDKEKAFLDFIYQAIKDPNDLDEKIRREKWIR